jgi:hypothetical protein
MFGSARGIRQGYRDHVSLSARGVYQRKATVAAADTSMAVTAEMLEVGQLLVDEAAQVTRPKFRAKISIDMKADSSPVTEADREAERRMRGLVSKRFPQHAVFGEEFGFEPGSGSRMQRSAHSYFIRICDHSFHAILWPFFSTKAPIGFFYSGTAEWSSAL